MSNALGRAPPSYMVLQRGCKDETQADSLRTLAPAPISSLQFSTVAFPTLSARQFILPCME